jgi:hypothetical protein
MNLGANGIALVKIPTDEVIEVQLVDDERRLASQGVREKDRVLDTLRLFGCTRITESFVSAQASHEEPAGAGEPSLQIDWEVAHNRDVVGEYRR